MDQRDLTFVIPTYRLRDVGKTVEQYDRHFWRNGHSVGPREKEQFLTYLNERLRDARLGDW